MTLNRHPRVRRLSIVPVALAALVLSACGDPTESWPSMPAFDTAPLERIVTQHNGRYPPLRVTAADVVSDVVGSPAPGGLDPILLSLAWQAQPDLWLAAPIVPVKRGVAAELRLPGGRSHFSFNELVSHEPLMTLLQRVSAKRGQALDDFEKKGAELEQRLLTLQGATQQRIWRVLPDPTDRIAPWSAPGEVMPMAPARFAEASARWRELLVAYNTGDAEAFAASAERFGDEVGALPAAYRPSAERLDTELHYESLRPYYRGWIALGVSFAATLVALLVRRARAMRLLLDVAAVLAGAIGVGILSYGLWLRWVLADRLPAANFFESLLFLSWGAGLFALGALTVVLFSDRGRLAAITGAGMSALSLCLADVLPLDQTLRPVAPVLLDTAWMAIHVPIIMVSYGVLAIAVFIAHLQVVTLAIAPDNKTVSARMDGLHYMYVFIGTWMLMAGILTGSMWGAASWGRYWGWDPKEVWSLVAFLAYMVILHVRVDREQLTPVKLGVGAVLALGAFLLVAANFLTLGPLGPITLFTLLGSFVAGAIFVLTRGYFATAVKSIIAFWTIVMTYLGVNYVLGIGLHSYGFGFGSVA